MAALAAEALAIDPGLLMWERDLFVDEEERRDGRDLIEGEWIEQKRELEVLCGG